MATTLLASAVGATAFAATPAYATPAPAPKIVSISTNPNPVIVKKDGSTQVTVSVRTTDVADVKVSIEPADRGGWGQGGGGFTSVDKDVVARFTAPVEKTFDKPFTLDWRAPVGSWKIRVAALGFDGRVYSGDGSFEVKRHHIDVPRPDVRAKKTRIVDLEASRNPVQKGRKFTLSGELQVAQCWGDWYYEWDEYDYERGGRGRCDDDRRSWHDWHWMADKKIGVYFRPRGSSEWKYVGYTKTDSDGSFEARVRAYTSGTWCVKFDGEGRLGGSQASTNVRVKRYYNPF
jgi:hypothetical protein